MGIERIGSFQKPVETYTKADQKKITTYEKSETADVAISRSSGEYSEATLKDLLHEIEELPITALSVLHKLQPKKAETLLE